MIVSLIVAMARNRVIGRDNTLPWHIPADLRRFRDLTLGHPIIMGRKTYESIGAPLAGRQTIVVTRQKGYAAPGCAVVHSLKEALAAVVCADEVFVCGGGELYREALPLAERIYLTVVKLEAAGDAFFPELPPGVFVETGREEVVGEPSCTFLVLERVHCGASTS
ncbi:dihydrofolate reductase [Geobacter argillaceus]|uniref:Dihydrofolate reductase n=1 Tax=Geobacter argillaceus TaxID=345631 RepID=A0A562VMS8_9BACT|nr:dihydrofolate reductase [Geobacter argillaceus]TWJ19209.1 dihydrofolate reductase [Geobacter argillaceus]